MNYRLMLMQHVEASADLTVGVAGVDRSEASRFGVCELDRNNRIVGWEEEPVDPQADPASSRKVLRFDGHHSRNRKGKSGDRRE